MMFHAWGPVSCRHNDNWTLGASEYLLKVGDLEVWTSAGPRAANIVDYFEMDADISSF